MAVESEEKEQPEKTKEVTFRCKICGQGKPLSQLREIKRFFPMLVACSECDEKMSGSGRKLTAI
jgi:hypothetical protein